MNTLIFAAAAAYMAHNGCAQAAHDRIFLRDIAPLIPAFGALSASDSEPIGWTPAPGARRVITSEELLRMARLKGFPLSRDQVRDVCVERAASPLRAKQIEETLSRMPELSGVEIAVTDFSRISVPEGRLEFSIASLGRPARNGANAAVLWRGRLVYDEGRTMPVWARLKLTRSATVIRAVRDIPARTEITAEMIEAASIREFPAAGERRIAAVEEAIGKSAARAIRAGEAIEKAWLREPDLISPGEKVLVTVESGGVRLSFEREAVSAGQLGRTIIVRDRSSGRTLRAETTGRGAAMIRTGAGSRI